MPFVRLSIVVLAAAASVFACTVEEGENPPARPNGVGQGESAPPSLPPPSLPSTDPGEEEGEEEERDAGSEKAPGPTTLPSGPTSGVDPDKTLGALTSAEKRQLCDWQAGIHGTYGRSVKCQGGLSVDYPKTQSECVQKMPPATCQATVAEAEACFKVDVADPCAFAILNAPECASLRDCVQ
jgi:hypothetical protein